MLVLDDSFLITRVLTVRGREDLLLFTEAALCPSRSCLTRRPSASATGRSATGAIVIPEGAGVVKSGVDTGC